MGSLAGRTRDSLFRHPAATYAALAVGAIAAVVLVLTTVDPWFPNVGIFFGSADLHVYEEGGIRVRNGLPLYTVPTPLGHLYTYTPFSALVFIPIVALPEASMDEIWMGFNILLLIWCIVLCWKIVGRRFSAEVLLVSTFLGFICTFLEPIRTTLFYGQVNIGLMLLVLWDVSRPEGSKLKGIGVGLAAGIKLTPAFFVAYFVVVKQWRAAVTAVVTIAATVGLGFALLPDDSREYWTNSVFQTHRIADPMHPANQSLRGMLNHVAGHPVADGPWLLIAVPAAIASLAVSALLYRQGERLLAVSLAGLTSAAVSPFSWSHHWVWFVPLLVYLFDKARTRPWVWLLIVPLYAAAASWSWQWSADFTVVGLFHYPPYWSTNWFFKNIFLFVYGAILAGSALTALRSRLPWPPRPSPDPADGHNSVRTQPSAADPTPEVPRIPEPQ